MNLFSRPMKKPSPTGGRLHSFLQSASNKSKRRILTPGLKKSECRACLFLHRDSRLDLPPARAERFKKVFQSQWPLELTKPRLPLRERGMRRFSIRLKGGDISGPRSPLQPPNWPPTKWERVSLFAASTELKCPSWGKIPRP